MRVTEPGSDRIGELPVLVDGRYEIVSRLGEGGQAAVFGVLDRRLGVARALKALLPELARRRKLRTRFESEARTMALLEHPNIVRVYDVSASGRTVYFVMEHVTGGSLSERVDRSGPLPPALAVRTLIQLCAGVDAAHRKGVVHRDIKPQNALIARDGTVKLVDFGIARTAEGHRTKAHAALGTLGFVSPEQLLDARAVDVRADVYSLGVTLFVLVTGADPNEWLRRRRHDRLPESLRVVVDRATREDPADRHPTVEALAAELEGCLPRLPPDPEGATLVGAPVLRREVEDPAPLTEVASWFDGALTGDDTSEEAAPPRRAEATSWVTPGPPAPRQHAGELPGWIEPPKGLPGGFEPTLEEEEREAPEASPERRAPSPNEPTMSRDDAGPRLSPRLLVALGVAPWLLLLLLGGGAYTIHRWQLAQAEDVRQVQAVTQLRRELDAQREIVSVLATMGADKERLDGLYRAFDEATDEGARLRAAEAIDTELHREAARVLLEGTSEAGRVESALRGLDRALSRYREARPELR